jgi:hypothetical protein
MNRNKIDNSQTDSSAIENILASEEELIPSSGFLATVMERVQEEARIPAPIPFPWKRAVPGILLAGGVFGWGAYEFIRHGVPTGDSIAFTPVHISAALERPLEQAGWVAMALAVSLVSWLLSRRIAGQSGL